MTLLDRLAVCPPIFCRLVARKHRGRAAMTRKEIADASGLSLRQVDYLSCRTSWRGVRVETADAFAWGCGVDLLHPKRHIDWFRRRKRAAWRGKEASVARLLRITLSK